MTLLVVLRFSVSVKLVFTALITGRRVGLVGRQTCYCRGQVRVKSFGTTPTAVLGRRLRGRMRKVRSVTLSRNSVLGS